MEAEFLIILFLNHIVENLVNNHSGHVLCIFTGSKSRNLITVTPYKDMFTGEFHDFGLDDKKHEEIAYKWIIKRTSIQSVIN